MSTLETYVAAWRDTAERVLALAEQLSGSDLRTPTDCPGWTVHDVLAHLAAIESELAAAGPPSGGHSTGEMVASLTEAGVAQRAGRSHDELLQELRTVVATRAEQLRDLPADPQAPASTGSTGLRWSWDRLLRNRVVDLWVHEQDIRRAVGRPGAMDTPGAHVTTHTFAAALPYVVGKKAAASPGTTVLVDITGPVATSVGVRVDESGRASPAAVDSADVLLVMDTETFTVLAAGRHPPADVDVQVVGDQELGSRVLRELAVTP
jgi:uncharacterized protein (TIGR03083 family)